MQTFIGIAVIVVVVLLVGAVLMQSRGANGGLFGAAMGPARTRRGVEKTLFQLTIGLGVVFVVLALANLALS